MSMLDKLLLKGKSDNGDGGCGGDGYGRVGERSGERGFTIVEVMIVIGIGALLAVLVLVAAGQLQQSGRNSTRVNDIGAIEGAIAQWSVNKNGSIPLTDANLTDAIKGLKLNHYKGGVVTNIAQNTQANGGDPTIWIIKNTDADTTAYLPTVDELIVITNASCDPALDEDLNTAYPKNDGVDVVKPTSIRAYAVLYGTEGNDKVQCRDNS